MSQEKKDPRMIRYNFPDPEHEAREEERSRAPFTPNNSHIPNIHHPHVEENPSQENTQVTPSTRETKGRDTLGEQKSFSEPIGDDEFAVFEEKGEVPQARLQDIAKKIAEDRLLSGRERKVRYQKRPELNEMAEQYATPMSEEVYLEQVRNRRYPKPSDPRVRKLFESRGFSPEEIDACSAKELPGLLKETSESDSSDAENTPDSKQTPSEAPGAAPKQSKNEKPAKEQRAEDLQEKDIEDLSPEEQEKAAWGLRNFGYKTEALKNNTYAKALGGVGKVMGENKVGRFFSSWGEQFAEKEQTAEKQIKALEKMTGQVTDKGVFAANFIKYGRLITDAVGWTAAPLKGLMLFGMIGSSATENAKELRLKNEGVMEKTRVEDIDTAAEQAWTIYEAALKRAEKNKEGGNKITAKELEQAYEKELPQDILKRLASDPQPGTNRGIFQRILRWDMEESASLMQEKLEKIDQNKRLTDAQKEERKEKYLHGFFINRSAVLKDFDRALSQQGAVDTVGMSMRYLEKGSRAIVHAMMVDSIYRVGIQLAETLSSVSQRDNELVDMLKKDTPPDVETRPSAGHAMLSGAPAGPESGGIPGYSPNPKIYNYTQPPESGVNTEEMKGVLYTGERSDMAAGGQEPLPPSPTSAAEAEGGVRESVFPGTREEMVTRTIDPTVVANMEVSVPQGGTLWGTIEEKLGQRSAFEGMSEGQRTHLIDALKDEFGKMSSEELREKVGISSGNIDQIKAGETINLSPVMEKAGFVSEAQEAANALSPETTQRIEENNERIAQLRGDIEKAFSETPDTPSPDAAEGAPADASTSPGAPSETTPGSNQVTSRAETTPPQQQAEAAQSTSTEQERVQQQFAESQPKTAAQHAQIRRVASHMEGVNADTQFNVIYEDGTPKVINGQEVPLDLQVQSRIEHDLNELFNTDKNIESLPAWNTFHNMDMGALMRYQLPEAPLDEADSMAKKMQAYLGTLTQETNTQPTEGETVEDFVKRALKKRLQQ